MNVLSAIDVNLVSGAGLCSCQTMVSGTPPVENENPVKCYHDCCLEARGYAGWRWAESMNSGRFYAYYCNQGNPYQKGHPAHADMRERGYFAAIDRWQ